MASSSGNWQGSHRSDNGHLPGQCFNCDVGSVTTRFSLQQCLPIALQSEPLRERQAIHAARRQFLADRIVPSGIPACILGSWQRSAAHGFDPGNRPHAEPLSQEQLHKVRGHNDALLQAAWGEIEALCRDMGSSSGVVILTDPEGVVLIRVGCPAFAGEADRMALQPGVNWSEHALGTNAIGLASIERHSVSVIGAEHFFESLGRMSCSAAPVVGPDGSISGVLALSTCSDVSHGYIQALLRRSVEPIERRLFECRFLRQERMHLHSDPYLLGSHHEGLLAFDGDRLVGANRNAIDLLGLSWSAVGSIRFAQIFAMQPTCAQANAATDSCVVQTARGATLFTRMQPPSKLQAHPHEIGTPAATDPVPAASAPPYHPAAGGSAAQVHEILARLLNGSSARHIKFRKMKIGHLLYGSEEVDKAGECFLVVRSGRLRCFVAFESKELTLFMLEAGDAIVLHPQSMLEVKKDCEIVTLSQSAFRQLAEDDPELSLAVVPVIERLLQRSILMIEDMAFHGVKYRLVRALCETADRDGRRTNQGVVIDIAPNGDDFAMQVGATRQSVSTVIAGLVRASVIRRLGNSSIVIPSLDRLKAEAETPC